ncbi:MAG: hypothetical protein AABY22_26465, partial [Nanoarchaeota archaeon]
EVEGLPKKEEFRPQTLGDVLKTAAAGPVFDIPREGRPKKMSKKKFLEEFQRTAGSIRNVVKERAIKK